MASEEDLKRITAPLQCRINTVSTLAASKEKNKHFRDFTNDVYLLLHHNSTINGPLLLQHLTISSTTSQDYGAYLQRKIEKIPTKKDIIDGKRAQAEQYHEESKIVLKENIQRQQNILMKRSTLNDFYGRDSVTNDLTNLTQTITADKKRVADYKDAITIFKSKATQYGETVEQCTFVQQALGFSVSA